MADDDSQDSKQDALTSTDDAMQTLLEATEGADEARPEPVTIQDESERLVWMTAMNGAMASGAGANFDMVTLSGIPGMDAEARAEAACAAADAVLRRYRDRCKAATP